MICLQFRVGIDQLHCSLIQTFGGVSVWKQETMWEMLIKLDNNSSERCLIHRLSVHNYYRMRKQEIRWGEEMRTENCKKNKTTELKKFQVTHSEVSWAHSSLPRCYAANHKELEWRSFSNKFHWSIEYETRLMPKRRKKKSYFQARVLKFSKTNQLSVVPVSSESVLAHSLK